MVRRRSLTGGPGRYGALLLAGLAGVLIGCSTTATPTAAPPTASPTRPPTAPPTATTVVPSATIMGPAATLTPDATRLALEVKAGCPEGCFLDPTIVAAVTAASVQYDAYQTAIALTPSATAGPTETTAPTRTPGTGMIDDQHCFPPLHGGASGFPSCWEAGVPGAWVLVAGGTRGSPGDPDNQVRSIILICPEPCGFPASRNAIYETPRNVREVKILAVAGNRVTFAPRDPAL